MWTRNLDKKKKKTSGGCFSIIIATGILMWILFSCLSILIIYLIVIALSFTIILIVYSVSRKQKNHDGNTMKSKTLNNTNDSISKNNDQEKSKDSNINDDHLFDTVLFNIAINDNYDYYIIDAGVFLIESKRASIGMLQRRFKIGFNRASQIMDQLESLGVVGPENQFFIRDVLVSKEEFKNILILNLNNDNLSLFKGN